MATEITAASLSLKPDDISAPPPAPSFWTGRRLGLVALVLLAAIGLLFANSPKPLIVEFTPQNIEQYQQQGFYGLESDPAGNKYRWTNGQASFQALLRSRHPVKLTLTVRNAAVVGGPRQPTRVQANGVTIGQINPEVDGAKFFTYSFEFIPAYEDFYQEIVTFQLTTPAFQSPGDSRKIGLMVQSVMLDTTPAWNSYLGRAKILDWLLIGGAITFGLGLLLWGQAGGGWLALSVGLLAAMTLYDRAGLGASASAGIAFLALSLWLFRQKSVAFSLRRRSGAQLAILAGLGLSAILVVRLILLGMVGYPGPHDQAGPPFWNFFGANAVIAAGLGWLALSYFPAWQSTSLWQIARQWVAAPVVRYNNLALLVYFLLANLAFTSVNYFQQLIMYGNLENLLRHWDSPKYLLNAVTLYDSKHPMLLIPSYSATFWETGFPGYALIVRALSYIIGYPAAMLTGNVLITGLWGYVLYRLLKDFNYTRAPLWIATLALILPVRWLPLHTYASGEPLAVLGATGAFYFFKKRNYWLAGLMGAVAQSARPNSILLYAGLLAALAWESYAAYRADKRPWQKLVSGFNWKAALAVSLIPATFLMVLAFYGLRTGDLLAYFHIPEGTLKDVNTSYIPFYALFQPEVRPIGQFYTYLLPLIGLAVVWKMGYFDAFWVALPLFIFNTLIWHIDMARYMMPVVPFLVIIPFARWLEQRYLRPVLVIIGLLAFFYSFYDLGEALMAREVFEQLKPFFK